MQTDPLSLLVALQLADSAFPAGGFAFSWGLEGLVADGLVADADGVAETIALHLTQRWHGSDRMLLARSHAAGDEAALHRLDRLAEAACFAEPLRAGSRRAGRALLAACARLGLPGLAAYRALCASEPRAGHLPVVQGLAFRAAGLSLEMAELLSGWGVISGLSGAAVRLGVIGHVEALRLAAPLRAVLAELLARPAHDDELPCSFTPLADIAMMRGAQRELRMFAT